MCKYSRRGIQNNTPHEEDLPYFRPDGAMPIKGLHAWHCCWCLHYSLHRPWSSLTARLNTTKCISLLRSQYDHNMMHFTRLLKSTGYVYVTCITLITCKSLPIEWLLCNMKYNCIIVQYVYERNNNRFSHRISWCNEFWLLRSNKRPSNSTACNSNMLHAD